MTPAAIHRLLFNSVEQRLDDVWWTVRAATLATGVQKSDRFRERNDGDSETSNSTCS